MKKLFACLLAVMVGGCPDIKTDDNEVVPGPTVEFDPARSLATGARFIPFPNDLARDPATGRITIGEPPCGESDAAKLARETLNQLDGFGAYEVAMQVTFTEAVDPASLAGNVVMYQVLDDGSPLDPTTAMPIPLADPIVGTTFRQLPDACDTPESVNSVVFVPAIPLRQRSTYVVALKKGIKSTSGAEFTGSYTWGLVSSAGAPVTLDDQGNIVADRTPLDPSNPQDREQLLALNQLWTGMAPVLAFLDATPQAPATRADLLVAWAFTTQTLTDPLDPAVEGSPANQLSQTSFIQGYTPATVVGAYGPYSALCGAEGTTNPTLCFLKLSLGGCSPLTTGCSAANYAIGNAACNSLYVCSAVGDVLGGVIGQVNYQTQIDNTLEASPGVTITAHQGAWSDPYDPVQQGMLGLQAIMTVPAGTAPADGWPVVIFGHGFGSKKETVLALAGRMSAAGFAVIAIDFVNSGSRAVRTSTDVLLGCKGHCFTSGGTDTGVACETIAQCAGGGQTCGSLTAMPGIVPPSPDSAPQCYDSIFSTDLAVSRDNFRQTMLDLQRVANAVRACGTTNCGEFKVDPTRVFYAGISLGSLIGTVAAATIPDLKAAGLDVGGAGWLDVLENTQTLEIRCPLVNGLIDAGILVGDKWTGGNTGLCVEDNGNAWKAQPGYAQFSAIARWVLDPADPANFAPRLAAVPHLIQEVVGDMVVPNIAQERQAALTGAAAHAGDADIFNPAAPTAASDIVATDPTESKLVRYNSDANQIYVHSSLLRPADATTPAAFGTLRLQVDLVQYLDNNDDDSLP
jgi:dienelactone hydrolase